MANVVKIKWGIMASFAKKIIKNNFTEILLFVVLLYQIYRYVFQASQIDVFSTFAPFVDDAFIHLRFIEHFAEGYGFVWNIGEQPVEGFTSFLYVVFLGVFQYFGGSPIHLLPWVGSISTILVLFATLWLLAYLNPKHHTENITTVILLGFSPQLFFWSFSGLEISFYILFLIICVTLFTGYQLGKFTPWLVGSMFGILSLIRPEALGLFAVTVIYDSLTSIQTTKTFDVKRFINLFLSFSIVFLPVFFWKWWYFGYPLPNTYYAKTGAGLLQIQNGYIYTISSIKQILNLPIIPIFLFVFAFYWVKHKQALYLVVIIIVICTMTTLSGGDHFSEARFLIPILPFVFSLVSIGISHITPKVSMASKFILLFGILVFTYNVWKPSQPLINTNQVVEIAENEKLKFFYNWKEGYTLMGKALNEITKPTDSIAVVPIGAIGYYSNIRVIDMVGLTDVKIAHEPFDPAYTSSWRPGHDKGNGIYILNQKPTYIQLVDLLSSIPYEGLLPESQYYKSIVEIWNSPEFLQLYEFYPIQVEGGWYYNLYRLKQ